MDPDDPEARVALGCALVYKGETLEKARALLEGVLERLAAAEADATRLLQLLGATASDPARALARRAYARWYRDYTALRRTGRYLVEPERDGPALFPGVGSGRGRGSSSKSTDAAADQAADQPDDASE